MPLFNITVTKTEITVYEPVEIDAPDNDRAIEMATEMAQEGELTEASGDETYTANAERIASEE